MVSFETCYGLHALHVNCSNVSVLSLELLFSKSDLNFPDLLLKFKSVYILVNKFCWDVCPRPSYMGHVGIFAETTPYHQFRTHAVQKEHPHLKINLMKLYKQRNKFKELKIWLILIGIFGIINII
jgi:hypothetical protein